MNLVNTFKNVGYHVGILGSILPGSVQGVGGSTAEENVDFIISFIGNALTILLVGVILMAIVYAVLAGIKYIQSQGASDQIEQAQGAIRSVVIGVIVAFVGMIVVVIIGRIFGVDTDTRQALICIISPSDSRCK